MRTLLGRLAAGLAAGLTAAALAAAPAASKPLVYAAASTAKAMDEAARAFEGRATASYAATGFLARQIEQGAPADLFLAANPLWMDHLVQEGRIDRADVLDFLSNRLVLIAPADDGAAPAPMELTARGLAERLAGERWAMGDPNSAPVGRYGRAAFEALGLWDAAGPALVPAKDTRAAVALVARGEVAFALVYATDAVGVDGVAIIAEIPEQAHPPIRYPLARVAGGADAPGAAAFLAFLTGPDGATIFARHGFGVVGADTAEAR